MTPEVTQARNPGKNEFGQSDIFHFTLRLWQYLKPKLDQMLESKLNHSGDEQGDTLIANSIIIGRMIFNARLQYISRTSRQLAEDAHYLSGQRTTFLPTNKGSPQQTMEACVP